jgi:hypothetical protein
VSDHNRPAPVLKSIVTELRRVDRHEALPAPEPAPSVDALSVDADLRGVKVSAGARGAGIAALQRVLIVLILVAGVVESVRTIVMLLAARRCPDIGRYTELSQTEGSNGGACPRWFLTSDRASTDEHLPPGAEHIVASGSR